MNYSKGNCFSIKFQVSLIVASFFSTPLAHSAQSFGPLGSLPVAGGVRTDQEFDINTALHGIEQNPAIRALLMRNRANDLRTQGAAIDSAVSTIKFKHFFHGMEVLGSQAFFHVSQGKSEISDSLARFDLNMTPKVSPDEAASLAQSYSEGSGLRTLPALKILPTRDGSARLIYAVQLNGGPLQGALEVQLDANTGELVAEIPDHLNIAPVNVLTARNRGIKIAPKFAPDPTNSEKVVLESCATLDLSTGETDRVDGPTCTKQLRSACQVLSLAGTPYLVNPLGCKEVVTNGNATSDADESALRAAENSKRTLTYFLSTHKRDGFDNLGSSVRSIVHVGDQFSNAFWSTSGNFMSYGDGDGEELGDFTRGVDVAGHEMSHGVVQHTARLEHSGEAASLNEAYADYFGKMIENRDNWLLGGDLFLKPSPTNGIRNLANPGSLKSRYIKNDEEVEAPYPSKVSEMAPIPATCTSKNDSCWAHFNATIPGHAFYLIHQAIGKTKAERLNFVTLSQFLTERANFKDAAKATLAACAKLFDQSTCLQVETVFTNVGMN